MSAYVPKIAVAVALAAGLPACATPSGNGPTQPAAALEEIYVFRSIREPREPGASDCSADKTGFDPFPADAERYFSFWSVQLEQGSGRVLQPKDTRTAALRACFGPTAEPARQKFHAQIELGAKSFRGDGECSAVRLDFPQAGLFPVHCWLVLSGLTAPYVGGLLTTNTVTSRAAYGAESNPPGYTQASVATIRLWKSK
jgi:hypothetical protein